MSITVTAPAAYIKGTVPAGSIVLGIGSATSSTPSTTYQAVGGITDISGSGVKLGTVASTDVTSRNVRRLGTTLDFGTITATIKNANSDTGQTSVSAAQLAAVPYDFVVQYHDVDAAKTVTIAFSALVTDFGAVDLGDEKVNTSKVELTLDGAWSITSA